MYPGLRLESAECLKQIGFDGYAVGGLSVGESEAERQEMLGIVLNTLHNLHYYQQFMQELRDAITEQRLDQVKVPE